MVAPPFTTHVSATINSHTFVPYTGPSARSGRITLDATTQEKLRSAPLVPATVVNWHKAAFEEGDEARERSRFIFGDDDVWMGGFGRVGILVSQTDEPVRLNAASQHKATLVATTRRELDVPDGPYLLDPSTGLVTSAAREFADELDAFVGGGVQRVDGDGKARWAWTGRDSVIVPSRYLLPKPSPESPLSGLRFAVKDAIDIAGLHTGNGSRGWRATYGPVDESAGLVDALVSSGALFVGKNNCVMFCDGQDVSQRFDYPTPRNPRGDAQQQPSSSSSGSAASVAGYPWLDFSIGTDTGGSIRHPAGVCGVYGLRPSARSIESRGFVVNEVLDTAGVFARSAGVLRDVVGVAQGRSLVRGKETKQKQKWRLLYAMRESTPDISQRSKWFPAPNEPGKYGEAEDVLESTVAKLEAHLGVTRHAFSVADLWRRTHPEGYDEDIAVATKDIYTNIVYYSLWHDRVAPFEADFASKFGGRKPFVEPSLRRRLENGKGVSKEAYEAAKRDHAVFAAWVRDVLFKVGSEGEGDDSLPLLVYPQTFGAPWYRTDVSDPNGPLFWSGFSIYSIAYCSGCPDVTVPVGEVGFESTATGTKEWLPVTLSALTEVGKDGELLDLLVDLEASAVTREVKTGDRI